jgi:hypothetical protein
MIQRCATLQHFKCTLINRTRTSIHVNDRWQRRHLNSANCNCHLHLVEVVILVYATTVVCVYAHTLQLLVLYSTSAVLQRCMLHSTTLSVRHMCTQ